MTLLAGPGPFRARPSPALGPACLGLIGCGLGWRQAAATLGAPAWIGELWLGAATALLAVCLAAYAAKVAARPGALAFDLRMPAGRGAVPAFSMGLLLAAAALVPLAPGLAAGVWWAGLALHAGLAALLARELAALPPDGRPATATLLVPFAGQVTAPLAGVALGFGALSAGLAWSAAAVWLALAPLILRRLRRSPPPPPMRPGVVILLAPPSVATTAFALTGADATASAIAFAVACVVLAGLLAASRWLTAGGWTPAWAAFGFPSAAFANATLTMAAGAPGLWLDLAAAAALTAASLVTLYVAGRTLTAWVTGRLAA